MRTCKRCGKNCQGDYCFQHKPRKPLKATRGSRKDYLVKKAEGIDKMREFFLQLWKKRKHVSEISGEYLGSTPLHIFFHHILEKNKYPEAMYDDENIILLTLDEHTNVDNNMYRYEEINNRRDYLIEKYNNFDV